MYEIVTWDGLQRSSTEKSATAKREAPVYQRNAAGAAVVVREGRSEEPAKAHSCWKDVRGIKRHRRRERGDPSAHFSGSRS